jgi:hypothetical protein
MAMWWVSRCRYPANRDGLINYEEREGTRSKIRILRELLLLRGNRSYYYAHPGIIMETARLAEYGIMEEFT